MVQTYLLWRMWLGRWLRSQEHLTALTEDPNLVPAPGELILSSGLFECQHTYNMYSQRYILINMDLED